MPTVYARPAWAWVARTMAARVSSSRSSRVNSRASARRLPRVASSASWDTKTGWWLCAAVQGGHQVRHFDGGQAGGVAVVALFAARAVDGLLQRVGG